MRTVHADPWIVVVDKPHGLPTQPDDSGAANVVDLLQREHVYVGLHHRLDRPASGLVVLAVDREANAGLAEAFRSHAAQRRYRAVVAGSGAVGDRFTWDAPLDGQAAVTHAEVVGAAEGMLAVEVRLETGRTHQIRRHAALAGLPIVGDRRHGGSVGGWWPRLCLHAHHLDLDHPVTGLPVPTHAPIPADMAPVWRRAGGPPDPVLRVATPDDAEAASALLAASYGALLPGAYDADVLALALPLMTTAKPELLTSGTWCVVAEGDRLTACGGWTAAEPGTGALVDGVGHVRHVATAPDRVRRGLAGWVLRHAIADAAAHGVTTLRCASTRVAVPFYEAHGFVVTDTFDIPMRGPDGVVPFPSVTMTRSLPR